MSMKKRLRKSSILLSLGIVIGGMYTSTSKIYAGEREIVRAEKLNVRKGPSVEEEKIGYLDRGMVVEIIETNNGWEKIKLSDEKEGWVSSNYTEKENGIVTATKLNIRKGPSVNNDKLGTLEKNSQVQLLEEKDNWFRIKLENNYEGWVFGDYILTESEKESKKYESNASENPTNSTSENTDGTLMYVEATAYAGDSITSTGTVPKWGTIAVDPTVIPYGTKVYIPKFDMVFTAEDCGSAIKSKRIDIFMNSESECVKFGRQNIEIKILK